MGNSLKEFFGFDCEQRLRIQPYYAFNIFISFISSILFNSRVVAPQKMMNV